MSLVFLNVSNNTHAAKNVACHAYSFCSFQASLEGADFLIVFTTFGWEHSTMSQSAEFSKYSSLLASYGCDADTSK